ncbi:MAG: hypothetical protein ABIJ61_01835, partial [bacterium]
PSKKKPPWDERGLYFLHFGPPDLVEDEPSELCTTLVSSGELWTWFPHSNRNERMMSVLFQPDCGLEWIAVPSGMTQRDYMKFGEVLELVKTSPPAGYSPDNREPLPFTLTGYRFGQRDDSTDLWLAYAFPVSELCKSCDSVRLQSTFVLSRNEEPFAERFGPSQSLRFDRQREIRLSCEGLARSDVAMQIERFTVPSGDYQIGTKIDDLLNSKRGFTGKLSLSVVPFLDPKSQTLVSDPMLLASEPTSGDEINPRFERIVDGIRLQLCPLPGNLLRRDQDSLRVYHEVYGLRTDTVARSQVQLTYVVFPDRNGLQQPYDTLYDGVMIGRGSAMTCYRSFSLEGVRRGEYFLLIECVDLNDNQLRATGKRREAILRFKVV